MAIELFKFKGVTVVDGEPLYSLQAFRYHRNLNGPIGHTATENRGDFQPLDVLYA
jgi:hypothetical protein